LGIILLHISIRNLKVAEGGMLSNLGGVYYTISQSENDFLVYIFKVRPKQDPEKWI